MRLATVVLLAACFAAPLTAHAQRRGRDGGGGGAGGPLGGPPGIGDAQAGPSSADMERRITERASLGDAVHKIPDFTDAEKDSVKALEKWYHDVFRSYGIAMRAQMDSARASEAMPDMRAMGVIREEVDSTRAAELAAARKILTSDAQRAKFDQNVAEITEREAKREEEMRHRRPMGGMGGATRGSGMRP
jgi:hypothetical protein